MAAPRTHDPPEEKGSEDFLSGAAHNLHRGAKSGLGHPHAAREERIRPTLETFACIARRISHETSTFARTPTTLRDFETGFGLFRGGEVVERFRSTNNCTGGFIDGAGRHGFELVPLLWGFAYPGGLIPQADYDALKGEFLDRLHRTSQGGLDGVLLDLHGAMVIEGIDDGDGDFIESVRRVVGPGCPIVATFDLHGNHTQRRINAATAVVGFDTYPHIDMAERGREAADDRVGPSVARSAR
jgi:microcystin degradation protein MlrC